MNKFRLYFILFYSIVLLFSSCKKDELEEFAIAPLNDASAQRTADNAVIENYLKTHYVKSISTNYDIIIASTILNPQIGGTPVVPIFNLNATTNPKLLSKQVIKDGVEYKVYYIVLREGQANKKPSQVDNLWITYSGKYLKEAEYPGYSGKLAFGTEFEIVTNPTNLFLLASLIQGWKEIIPFFGAGNQDLSVSPNDPVAYSDYGAGVMFLPSGLAYFNEARQNIPAYSPLQFSFRLLDITRSDLDNDKINSIDEDLNNNGLFTDDDTDGDGIQNYIDFDDDNDGYPTSLELKKTDGTYYDFLGAPDCSGNLLLPIRIKKYLDKTCH